MYSPKEKSRSPRCLKVHIATVMLYRLLLHLADNYILRHIFHRDKIPVLAILYFEYNYGKVLLSF